MERKGQQKVRDGFLVNHPDRERLFDDFPIPQKRRHVKDCMRKGLAIVLVYLPEKSKKLLKLSMFLMIAMSVRWIIMTR